MSAILEYEVRLILGRVVHTHWGKRIVNAAKRNRFMAADSIDGEFWSTCGCGKMYTRKPYAAYTLRKTNGEIKGGGFIPIDNELNIAGRDLSVAIHDNDAIRAAHALFRIEERAASLLYVDTGAVKPQKG